MMHGSPDGVLPSRGKGLLVAKGVVSLDLSEVLVVAKNLVASDYDWFISR